MTVALPRTWTEVAEATAIAAVSGLRVLLQGAGETARRRPMHDVLLVRTTDLMG
jgi:hypothetical protein